ncbi:hypothetical protein V1524DRAFT_466919 [Lipomyces starkeyi]
MKFLVQIPLAPRPLIIWFGNAVKVQTAMREAIEESGYSLEQIYHVVPMYSTGSRSTLLHHACIRELISRQDPKGYIATCRVIAEAPTPDFSVVAKSDRKIPALVLAGADDKMAPFDGCVDKIAERLHAEVQFDGVGHWHAIEAPKVVTDAIRELFKRSEKRF